MRIPECRPSDFRRIEHESDATPQAIGDTVSAAAVAACHAGRGNVIPFDATRLRKSSTLLTQQSTLSTPETTAFSAVNTVDELPADAAQFCADIRAVMMVNEWSLGEVSRKSGVDKGQLSKILNGKTPLTATAFRALRPLTTAQATRHTESEHTGVQN